MPRKLRASPRHATIPESIIYLGYIILVGRVLHPVFVVEHWCPCLGDPLNLVSLRPIDICLGPIFWHILLVRSICDLLGPAEAYLFARSVQSGGKGQRTVKAVQCQQLSSLDIGNSLPVFFNEICNLILKKHCGPKNRRGRGIYL